MYLKLDENKQIYYEKFGSGEPLIMVHGNGENSTIFAEAVEKLKDKFTVYTLDSPGHGNSYKLDEYHYDIMASDICDFIAILGIKNPIFYGFSDGGIIGLLIAIKHPNLLKTLIVSGANAYPRGLKYKSYLGMKIGYLFSKAPLVKMMLTEPNIGEDDLHKITCKTYVLAGSRDVISYRHTRFIADNIKNSTLMIIPDQTHGSYIVHSTKIADIIIDITNS